MHGLADIVIAPEGEREVADTPADMGTSEMLVYPFRGADEVSSIGIMLFHARGHSQHIRVEDDVLWQHAHLFCQKPVGPLGYLYPALIGSGLSLFIETHHHHGSTQSFHITGMSQERLFTFFEGDGVDDRLTLYTLQTRQDHLPV